MKRGFTLIELIIVISVIAILAGIVTPLIGSILEEARKSRMFAEVNTLCTAIAGFNQKSNMYPTPGAGATWNCNGLPGSGTTYGYANTQAAYNILVGTGTTRGAISTYLDKRIPTDPFGNWYYYMYNNTNAAYGLGVVGSYGPNMVNNNTWQAVSQTCTWYLGRVDTATIGDDYYKCFYKRG